ncbi:hypothetical protein V8C43DRAFT_44267 [Trichoderma afarasin]
MMMPVYAQWVLDTTEDGLFSACKPFLSAAACDNVQPLSLAVCQAFGDTLAICSESIEEIGKRLFREPSPAPVVFPQASIGFSENDSATALAGTLGGQRFLCLAAALVTSVGPLDGAKAIRAMMQASKVHEGLATYIPTTRQLADILKSLDARSVRCGFRDLMVKWEIILRREVFPHLSSSTAAPGSTSTQVANPKLKSLSPEHLARLKELDKALDSYAPHGYNSTQAKLNPVRKLMLNGLPHSETIARIVGVFTQLAHSGNKLVFGVNIKAGAGAAWVLAFTQWCLGTKPALYVDDKRIFGSPDSLIRVTIPRSSSNTSIEVITHHRFESDSSPPQPAVKATCYGMVSLETYGEWLRHEFGFADEYGRRLLPQLLNNAIPHIFSNTTCGEFGRLGQNSNLFENFEVSDPIDLYRPTALPDKSRLEDICYMITGEPQAFTICQDGQLFRDLPLFKLHVKLLKTECQCDNCRGDEDFDSESEICAVDEFYLAFSSILADIFALSLFESRHELFIKPSRDRHNEDQENQLIQAISSVLRSRKQQIFEDEHLLQWARAMVGHDFDDEDRCLIITSGRGQVVYPSVYGSGRIERVGYLRLSNFCGVFRYEGDVYNVVSSPDDGASDISGHPGQLVYKQNQNIQILQPMNLYPNASFSWKIAAQDDGEIQADFLVRVQNSNFTATRSPSFFITALKDTLFYEDCLHDSQSRLEEADRFTTNQLLWHEEVAKNDENPRVNIIAVDGSEGLRRFALADANGPVVLRRDACLRCCLDLCRRTSARRLIL